MQGQTAFEIVQKADEKMRGKNAFQNGRAKHLAQQYGPQPDHYGISGCWFAGVFVLVIYEGMMRGRIQTVTGR